MSNHPDQPISRQLFGQCPLLSVLNAGSVLFTGAHPDDIEFYCAATVRILLSAGAQVRFLIATGGDHQLPGFLGSFIKRKRLQDQQSAAEFLGITEVRVLDYPDGGLAKRIDRFTADIDSYATQIGADTIFGWDPEYTSNPHADHVSGGKAVAACSAEARFVYYGTKGPDCYVNVDDTLMSDKLKALRLHKTETPWPYFYFQKKQIMQRMQTDSGLIETFRLSDSGGNQ